MRPGYRATCGAPDTVAGEQLGVHRAADRQVRVDDAVGGPAGRHRRATVHVRAVRSPAARRTSIRRGRRDRPVPGSLARVQVRRRRVRVAGGVSRPATRWPICATSGSAATSTATPKASCISRFPGAFGARQLRRMRDARDAGAVDLQPRHRRRLGGRADGQRRRGTAADGDGLAPDPRTGRRRGGPRRLHRGVRRVVQPGRPSPLRRPDRRHQRACLHAAAHADGPDEPAAFAAQVDALGAGTTLLVDTYDVTAAWPTRWPPPAPGSARCASTPATWACWPAKSAPNSTGSGPTKTRIVVSGDLDEFAVAGLRAEPVDSYGVGTSLVTGSGAPTANMVYKLVEVDGIPVEKRSATRSRTAAVKRRCDCPVRPAPSPRRSFIPPAIPRPARAVAGADGSAVRRGESGRRPGFEAAGARTGGGGLAKLAVGGSDVVARRSGDSDHADPGPHARKRRRSHAQRRAGARYAAAGHRGGGAGRQGAQRPTADGHRGGARLRNRRAPRRAGRNRHRKVVGVPGSGDRPRLVRRHPVVVSTATIALQRQLVNRDLPQLVDALTHALPRAPRFALLKGRQNYLCLNKIHNGAADDQTPPEELFDAAGGHRVGSRRAAAHRSGRRRPSPVTATTSSRG